MPKLLIFDVFTLFSCEKNVANYALLRCKTFSLKIWMCKIFDKFHVWCAVMVNMKNTSFEKHGNSLYNGVCPYVQGDG